MIITTNKTHPMCFSLKEMVLTFSSFSADIVMVSHTNTRAEGRTQTHSHSQTNTHTPRSPVNCALFARAGDTAAFIHAGPRAHAHTHTRRRDGASATIACCCPLPEIWVPSAAHSDVTQVRRLIAGVFR